ncbi:MAG: hypothetical protein COW71_01200 [Ignavibacteriales bacterium CG18_big_fil_WC_8_21_14_2_50_31_20]|nr:MAG: hypothetical protein COW71_01200 [Ignavibacteriales bacterium CG18_big_fil_WC_8_21_14_2_50_31_20]
MEQNNNSQRKISISNFIFILYKWKKFLIINMIIVLIITAGITLLMSNQYKSTATIMAISNNNSGLGGLSSLISGGPIASMGAQLLGVGGGNTDIIFGILNSRATLVKVINEFGLMKYYEIDDNNMDDALKAFREDAIFETNEYGMSFVNISVINKDSVLSAEIANYFVQLLDSINIKLNIEQARNNREFIEKRYLKNVADLNAAEDSLYFFQKKYGIITVPEQFEIIYKAAAEIEAKLVESEITASLIKDRYGKLSPQYDLALNEVLAIKNKVKELKNSKNIADDSNIFVPFQQFPEISLVYMRIFREVELQGKIMEFLVPMYEQAKVEEQKSIPTVVVLDKAVPSQVKDSPRRSIIVVGIGMLFFFMLVTFVYRGEYANKRTIFENTIEEKETSFFNKIRRIYRMR